MQDRDLQPCRLQVREARPPDVHNRPSAAPNSSVDARGIARLQAGACYAASHPGALIVELQAVAGRRWALGRTRDY